MTTDAGLLEKLRDRWQQPSPTAPSPCELHSAMLTRLNHVCPENWAPPADLWLRLDAIEERFFAASSLSLRQELITEYESIAQNSFVVHCKSEHFLTESTIAEISV